MSRDAEELARYRLADEIANAITHGLGLVLAVIGFVFLLYKAIQHGDVWHVASCATYGATLVILYAASTVYHGVQRPALKRICRTIDHSAIFLLIAGTYTPFTLVTMRSEWGWTLFFIVWGIGLLGVLYKLIGKGKFRKVSAILYIGMGWLAVIAIEPLLRLMPTPGLWWIAAGGLIYTAGVLFYVLDHRRFFHAVWHLFVIGGSVCHYVAVLLYVVPPFGTV